jgi:GMP synthase PP-ATPase subunit
VDSGKIIDDAVERIRQQVGDDKVILACPVALTPP